MIDFDLLDLNEYLLDGVTCFNQLCVYDAVDRAVYIYLEDKCFHQQMNVDDSEKMSRMA